MGLDESFSGNSFLFLSVFVKLEKLEKLEKFSRYFLCGAELSSSPSFSHVVKISDSVEQIPIKLSCSPPC